MAHLFRVRAHRSVGRHLIVFYTLAGGYDGRIAHGRRRILAHHLVAFVQYPLHAFAFLLLGFLAMHFEYFVQPRYVVSGLFQMIL